MGGELAVLDAGIDDMTADRHMVATSGLCDF
jgi:hypothetical protein